MLSMALRSYQQLEVWQLGMELTTEIYRLTANYPQEEKFGLVSQLRRCVVSIPSNIAEGQQRDSTRDFLRFLSIARGSLAELQTQLLISQQLGFASSPAIEPLLSRCQQEAKMLASLQRSLNNKLNSPPNP